MAVKIRLSRGGSKKKPFYKVVVANSACPRDGRNIDTIGHYDATKSPADVKIDSEKALAWMKNGAQPTDTVRNLFSKAGIMKQWQEMKSVKKEG